MWTTRGTVLIYGNIDWKCDKIAMFDLDDTLTIRHKPLIWKYDSADVYLRKLEESGYKIIIVTNQKNLLNPKNSIKKINFKHNIEIMFNKFKDIVLFAACGEDKYRKPSPNIYTEFIFDNIIHDKCKLWYVGDAAGRTYDRRKPDFSDVDRGFAHNITIYNMFKKRDTKCKFIFPEVYFGGKSTHLSIEWTFNPRNAKTIYESMLDIDIGKTLESVDDKTIIIVGLPKSGKTHVYNKIFKDMGYVLDNKEYPDSPLYIEAKYSNLENIAARIDNYVIVELLTPLLLCRHYAACDNDLLSAQFTREIKAMAIAKVNYKMLPYFHEHENYDDIKKRLEFNYIRL